MGSDGGGIDNMVKEGNRKRIQDIVLLIFVNFIVHGLMIFVSGYWWDDYKYAVVDTMEAWKDHYFQAGRPIAYYMIASIHGLPIWMFRSLVLGLYAYTSVLFYAILKKIGISRRTSLLIAIIFVAIPVNDARIMICVYPYTLALVLFFLATYLLIGVSQKRGHWRRVLSLVLFFCSFANSALLFFYVLPMAYILYFELKDLKVNGKLTIRGSIFKLIRYVDFCIIPVAFWVCKKKWFAPFGLYEGYNAVTASKLVSAVKNMIPIAGQQIVTIFDNGYSMSLKVLFVIGCISIIVSVGISFLQRTDKYEKVSKMNCMVGIIIGCVIFCVGLFPYVTIRTRMVLTTAVGGRDAMLLGFGSAIIIYYIVELISVSRFMTNFLVCILVLCGCVHFGGWYLTYQGDYYEEVALQQYWLDADEIKQGTNFIHIDNNERRTIEGLRYYSLNHMAYEIFGTQSRFFANGVDDLYLFIPEGERELYSTYKENEGLENYDFSNCIIDGIEEYRYDVTYVDIVKLKLKELFDTKAFYKEVKRFGKYRYTSITEEQSVCIMEAYRENQIEDNRSIYSFINN